jgi:hypothetical protein
MMMKCNKNVLVIAMAMAGISGSALASDTLADAFSDGQFKGQVKSYYFDESYDSNEAADNNIWTNGGFVNYNTAEFYGFSFGTTLQTSHVTNIDDPADKMKTSMNAQGAVMSESYIGYKYNNTSFKGGRQYMALPLIKSSGSRLIKESFEAYSITNTDLPNTLVSLANVTKYQTRTDKATKYTNAATFFNDDVQRGDVGGFYDIGTDGAVSLYIKNNSVENLNLQAHYVDFIDEVADLYVDATYTFGGEFHPFVAAQYYGSNYDDAATEDSSLMGYKVGASFGGYNVHASYTTVDQDGSVNRGIGEAATASFTSSTLTSGNYNADADTWQVGVAKSFADLKLKLFHTETDNPISKNQLTQTYLDVGYTLSGAFKGCSTSIRYTVYDYGTDADAKDKGELRAKFFYSF